MTLHRSFSPSADLSAQVPSHTGARSDRVEAAIHSLGREAQRLERLGLRHALTDCRRQLRYWEFLRALFTLETQAGASRGTR